MGSPSRNVQYHPPRLSEDRINLPQPHSPSLPTHCSGKSGMRPTAEPLVPVLDAALKPGEKKHAKRMAVPVGRTVYTTAPSPLRSPEESPAELDLPRQPVAPMPRAAAAPPGGQERVWASPACRTRIPGRWLPMATLEAERQDPEHVKRLGRGSR